ncbi:MAG: hypothetical protein M3018_06640 [Actinomycetota bacterium]|nr:hypothetical protein [Actinomycetota bacterium]
MLRTLALLVVLALAIFCAGAVAAAINNVAHPTCADVRAGSAQLPADGSCYGKSVFQQYGTLVLVCLAAVAVGAAMVFSLVLLFKGRRGRVFLVALAAGVALLLLALLLEHV